MISKNHSFDFQVELHLFDAGQPTIRARLNGASNGVFQLCSPMYVPPCAWLEMRHPERKAECQVVYCKRQASGFLLGLVLACDVDRRSENRIAVDLTGELHIPNWQRTPVRVIDVSRSGLGLEVATRIPVEACMALEMDSGTAIGEIRHCAKSTDGYRAGMWMHEFAPHVNARRIVALGDSNSATGSPMATLARSIQQRQARYEAILFSFEPLAH